MFMLMRDELPPEGMFRRLASYWNREEKFENLNSFGENEPDAIKAMIDIAMEFNYYGLHDWPSHWSMRIYDLIIKHGFLWILNGEKQETAYRIAMYEAVEECEYKFIKALKEKPLCQTIMRSSGLVNHLRSCLSFGKPSPGQRLKMLFTLLECNYLTMSHDASRIAATLMMKDVSLVDKLIAFGTKHYQHPSVFWTDFIRVIHLFLDEENDQTTALIIKMKLVKSPICFIYKIAKRLLIDEALTFAEYKSICKYVNEFFDRYALQVLRHPLGNCNGNTDSIPLETKLAYLTIKEFESLDDTNPENVHLLVLEDYWQTLHEKYVQERYRFRTTRNRCIRGNPFPNTISNDKWNVIYHFCNSRFGKFRGTRNAAKYMLVLY